MGRHSAPGYHSFRNVIVIGGIFGILIWGSGFLIQAITSLKLTHELVYQPSPQLLSNIAKPSTNRLVGDKIPLNFSSAREGIFTPEYTELQWIKEPNSISNDKGTYVVKEHLLVDGTEDIYDTLYSIKSIVDSDYEYLLFNGSSFYYNGIEYDIEQLTASPDLTKAFIKTNSTHNYRHSTYSLYWLLDVNQHTISPIKSVDDKFGAILWSPTSNHLAFVLDNNLYIKDVNSGDIKQVTTDGSDQIFYGRPDWVYEEEVFASDKTMWWSPTGDKLSFTRMDDTEVPKFTIPYYVQEGYEDYPKLLELKYPKAGYPNAPVDVGVYDLTTEEFKMMDLKSDSISDKLVTQVFWASTSDLMVRISTRASDLLEYYLLDTKTHDYKLIRTETMENGWFEVAFDTFFIPKNEKVGLKHDGYIDTVVVDGYNHLAYFSPPSNPEGVLLTKGQWEIEDGQVSFDYTDNEVYFISTMKSPVERHVHSVNLLDALNGELPQIKNITDTSKEGYYRGSFSSGSRYLLLTYRGPSIPYQQLIDLRTSKTVKTLETNSKLTKTISKYDIPKVEHKVISIGKDDNGDDIIVNAVETFPLNFNPKMKYPVLFYVYGGPGSQTVTKTFKVDFSAIVAAELNAIVVTVDGRGTGFNTHNKQGAHFKYTVRNQLGHYEPIDQISAAKIWAQKSYVDAERIAIWGWSYGGFMTLKTLETDDDHIFKYGMSVAPVTKWKFYDSIYTERYMRTPAENPEGYEIASISNMTNFHNVTRFLMMHGSGDDNVHFQNSLKLIDDFNLDSIENFDFMVYPDSDHSIVYHNGNHVIYHRLLKWLRKAFNNEYL
ncbi:dipeptidyl aminopeptidase B [[Candida] jaroonii]|uniref:Dipeptidyl aminopeptidase B n=1 Tax=[Candida] jaroonii TaxID=467808 RepID=A0ACA9Y579_9ASCO|nr:dipeptidyl aminopeptidase B [[Candida] jaroonii]